MGIPSRLEPTADAIRGVAEAESRIVAVYLFGSLADGTAIPDSDIDLGVLFDRSIGVARRARLQARFSDALGKDVDLVDVGTCDAFLALSIIRGERLYCTDIDRADEFDLYVMRRAGDLEPFERQRRRMLLAADAPAPAR